MIIRERTLVSKAPLVYKYRIICNACKHSEWKEARMRDAIKLAQMPCPVCTQMKIDLEKKLFEEKPKEIKKEEPKIIKVEPKIIKVEKKVIFHPHKDIPHKKKR